MRPTVNDIPSDWTSLPLGRQFVQVLLLVLDFHLLRRWFRLLVFLMTTCLFPQRLLERLTRLFRLLHRRVRLNPARYVITRVTIRTNLPILRLHRC